MENIYEWADNQINKSQECSIGFTQLISNNPYYISINDWENYKNKIDLIRTYQQISLEIFVASINNKLEPDIYHWLMNETPDCIGAKYHKVLKKKHFTIPVFFRTDEASIGKIIEIQPPGSLWGELQLIYEYIILNRNTGITLKSPAELFVKELIDYIGDNPIVQHLIDNSSIPWTNRYFIQRTRGKIQYWGIDKNIKQRECNFIRSHSFYSICSDNEFYYRINQKDVSKLYDLPPHVLFDQKASLVLPFWSKTKKYYPDKIRDLFAYTTPLTLDRLEMQDGCMLTIQEFSKMSRSYRSYYLKYAGSDVSKNWGSKAVYRLSNYSQEKCENILRRCVDGYLRGEVWLLQKEEKTRADVEYISRDGLLHKGLMDSKISAFYGPKTFMGAIAMHRNHYKVHGQNDTVISFVLPDLNKFNL